MINKAEVPLELIAKILILIVFSIVSISCNKLQKEKINSMINSEVPDKVMENIYQEVKTPFKYGVVLKHPDTTKVVDSPTIFRFNNLWLMTYIIFDGHGYETWLAESVDLLHWKTKGRILSFTKDGWDASQKAGYPSLVDHTWGGSYAMKKYNGNYWMSYLGGSETGYEAGTLGVGIATTDRPDKNVEWLRLTAPVLSPSDPDARWFENKTIFKSHIIHDSNKFSGYSFIMYYNAKGIDAEFESIGMAVSDNMTNWKRYGEQPIITKRKGICGDAQIVSINEVYVMFYFGAFWKPGAFERFACSYDLIHWTDWKGEDLISPSTDYDRQYAHKPWVIKWQGMVYHFYTATGSEGRVIALATSKKLPTNFP